MRVGVRGLISCSVPICKTSSSCPLFRKLTITIPHQLDNQMNIVHDYFNQFLTAAMRRFPPVHPLQRQCQLCSGGSSRAIRGTCVISVASSERPAMQKCRFSGLLPHPRLSFRREICKMCNLCIKPKLPLFPPSLAGEGQGGG